MIEVNTVFPYAIAQIPYENHEIIKEKIITYINNNPDKELKGITDPNLCHYFMDDTEKFFDCIVDEDFKNFLKSSCEYFLQNVLLKECPNVIITDCWISNCYKDGRQRVHTHGNSYISGTYYVNYIPGLHAPLFFDNPRKESNHPFFDLYNTSFNEFNAEYITMKPEEGLLYLWQSNMPHGFGINNCDGRISVSMNFVPSILTNGSYSFKIVE
jgi:uncharacterized protein (TIGR02466 family)